MINGYVSISKAAELAGVDKRLLRQRLKMLHEQHGNVLFTFCNARNAKLWTTPAALIEHLPERFDQLTQLDLLEVREQLSELRARQARLERMVLRKGA